MGGRGAGAPKAIREAQQANSAKNKSVEEKTTSFSFSASLNEKDDNITKTVLLPYDAEDYGGAKQYNAAKKAQKLLSKSSEDLNKLEATINQIKGGVAINSEDDRQKYFKELAQNYKKATLVLNTANKAYQGFEGAYNDGRDFVYWDMEDRRHTTDKIITAAQRARRLMQSEGEKYRVMFSDNGEVIQYPDYKKRK